MSAAKFTPKGARTWCHHCGDGSQCRCEKPGVFRHTPGPWARMPGGFCKIKAADGRRIADLCADTESNEYEDGERLANARLIAAAPELLAVSNDAALGPNETESWEQFGKRVGANARAAIAKARGES